ncbi:MAG TPA: DNA-binding protein [Caldisericia bacterium]|nr:DNA-binding protein [Caldisericia bacterium]HPF49665.1 DNA-binding protein [Caldisericia bacterium]HPI84562.1 DNA-binding protein [Caldisericia bacterium]HPQ93677.1 DNA-binding protein [Caldisericia bacterium]HRV74759.1 DNA-binding protein [Caldisericia bacterium]
MDWRLSTDKNTLAIVCRPGDDFMRSLVQACDESGFGSGFITSCIGALRKVRITSVVSSEKGIVYAPIKEYSGACELIVASGNVEPKEDGGWKAHVHALLDYENSKLFAGHLDDEGNVVGITAEILISKFPGIKRGLPTPLGPSFIEFVD